MTQYLGFGLRWMKILIGKRGKEMENEISGWREGIIRVEAVQRQRGQPN